MPAIFPTGSLSISTIRSLASRGDYSAQVMMAFLDNTYYCAMTAAAEAGNAIVVTIQVKDQDGQNVAGVRNVLVKTKAPTGTGNISDAGNGTISAGAASSEAWCKTDVNGSLQVAVANANAEGTLVMANLDNGTVEMLELTFA